MLQLELVVLFVVVLAVRRAVLLAVLAILVGFVLLILVVLILIVLVVLIIILRHNLFPPVSLGYKSIIFFLIIFYTLNC